MKTLSVLVLVVLAVGAGHASFAEGPEEDWRLRAFDEANGCLAKEQANEQAFIISKEPKLAEFYGNVLVPWQDAMQRLRRVVFIKKLKGRPEMVKMDESPWRWALQTPARPDEIEIWLRDDKDGAVQKAYDEVKRTLEAFRRASVSLSLRNEVIDRFKPEFQAIEGVVVTDLNSLEDRVRAHLAAAN
jgi:hypothetical protein